ncbi:MULTISPECIES: Lcl C-terminal domain-containing protein [Alkalimonas]|uniref:DUF1566 domain-containing protein n=1 Tax=Alkalimonas mucilaginosa TaxID=3057676 RepID=A0ABU7JJC9_9GAMM|nr:DUF1566 domain-containing protein [Alkalimonas sp. MEB004]MEE2025785.1 DUF1566 domain-containing protein [Alkalimonas sp. MEB004]
MSLFYRNFLLALPVLCFFAACQPLDTPANMANKEAPEPAFLPNRELPDITVFSGEVFNEEGMRIPLSEEQQRLRVEQDLDDLEVVYLRLRNSRSEQQGHLISDAPRISGKLAEAFYTQLCHQDVLVVALEISIENRHMPRQFYEASYIHAIFDPISGKRLTQVWSSGSESDTGARYGDHGPLQASLKAGTNNFCPELLEWANQRYAKDWLLSLPAAVEMAESQSFVPPAATNSANGLIDDRYRDNGDGTVTDIQTNLTWMRCVQGLHEWTGSACIRVDKRTPWAMSWEEAQNVAKNVSFAGYSDWRLPTADELDTLVLCPAGRSLSARPDGRYVVHTDGSCHGSDFDRPKINSNAFPDTPSERFWTSTSVQNGKSESDFEQVFIVNFRGGSVMQYRRNPYERFGVRLVRGEASLP